MAGTRINHACTIDGCQSHHYNQVWRNGTTTLPKPSSKPVAYKKVVINGRQMQEHRWVMEQIIGRPLLAEENVHHKNGVRNDNRPENLELWNTSQPAGQRVEDKLAWAEEIIALYRGSKNGY